MNSALLIVQVDGVRREMLVHLSALDLVALDALADPEPVKHNAPIPPSTIHIRGIVTRGVQKVMKKKIADTLDNGQPLPVQ